MCYAKVDISSKKQFKEIEEVLSNDGYKWNKKREAEGDCLILLWRDDKKKRLSLGAKSLLASCRKVDMTNIKQFLAGRRKTAQQCKNGVYRIDLKTKEIVYFKTVKLAAKALGHRSMNIYKAANPFCSELKTAYGYEWTYDTPQK